MNEFETAREQWDNGVNLEDMTTTALLALLEGFPVGQLTGGQVRAIRTEIQSRVI
jgi:hypothetical protein